ncbi:unnamed protein product [Rotaria sordida]|uniref:Uncharacterized protein n=1 Tax=Rotaria sordida TaxID=392033 RepID=A0A814R664_9BILA|nr:unnamed protein product [Rotaria sordida]CAF3692971.1 unnamed protein product [Rotaria sordida]
MFLFGLTFSINLLFIFINAENHIGVNNVQRSAINMDVVEHEPNNNVHYDQSEQITPEKVLIRVPRLKTENEKLKINKRERRQLLEALQTAGFIISVAKAMKKTESGEEILGMAKKVAIIVLVFVSLCTVCCFVTIIIICVKCCCGNNNRKRNAEPTTVQVPQPIIIHHTGPSGYQPQYYQQPAPQSWNSVMVRPPESRPMLPQPSAPPRPNNDFHIEYVPPPPYEKLYTSK